MAYYQDSIIDGHMHLWDLNNRYDWLHQPHADLEQLIGDYAAMRHTFLPADYQVMVDGLPVVKSVHVQALGFPDDPVGESRWLAQQGRQTGFPHAIVGYANLADPGVEAVLAAHADIAGVRGIRMILSHDALSYRCLAAEDYLQNPQWLAGFALLKRYQLSFDVQIYDHQIPAVIKLAQQHPETVLVINHLAWPLDCSEEGFALWRERIGALASACPNVVMKLSGVGIVFRGKLPEQTIASWLQAAVDAFGPSRCLFGSNCPPDRLFYAFRPLFSLFQQAMASYTAAEQRQIFHDTAARVYRFQRVV